MKRFLPGWLLTPLVIATPMIVYASTGTGGLGSGRFLPTLGALIGLTGLIIGLRARKSASRPRVVTALILSVVCLIIGILHAANSAGGFGTGNGLAGAVVAKLLGLAGTIISGLALMRMRKF